MDLNWSSILIDVYGIAMFMLLVLVPTVVILVVSRTFFRTARRTFTPRRSRK